MVNVELSDYVKAKLEIKKEQEGHKSYDSVIRTLFGEDEASLRLKGREIRIKLTEEEYKELVECWEDAKKHLVNEDGSPYNATIEELTKELLFERIREL